MKTLDVHKKAIHDGVRFECTICKKSFAHEGSLRQHNKTHGGLKYNCDVCNQTFTQPGTLQRHKRSIHEGVRFDRRCKFCKEVFTHHRKLKAHLKIHEDELEHEKLDEDLHEENENSDPEAVENYECKKCELSFASYKILQMHKVMVHQ